MDTDDGNADVAEDVDDKPAVVVADVVDDVWDGPEDVTEVL